MTRPTLDEIRQKKTEIEDQFDRSKTKPDRERLGFGLSLLRWVLGEKP